MERLHELLPADLRIAREIDWSRAVVEHQYVQATRGATTGPSPVDRARNGSSTTSSPTAAVSHSDSERATANKEIEMANPVPAGSDVSAGTYECTNCGNRIDVGSTKHLPPCPSCGNGEWMTISGGDAADDPYPDR